MITKSGQAVYDEKFHRGVNIIRGKNSSGKSTIADFIFYALGGDITKWKEEAKSCDFTVIEVELSGKVFTLKREITEKSRRGMDIFAGNLEEANASNIEGWLRYPYQATENKESYYQAIFKELEIPYSKSEDNNSITLHQLLRLMYVDQMTSLDRLFKFDKFDSPNKRQAIGELMIGLSDYDLYENRIRRQKLEALLDNKVKEIKILHQFFGDEIKTVDSLDIEISNIRKEVIELENHLAKNSDQNCTFDQNQITILRERASLLQREIRGLLESRAICSFEISDSQNFVKSLDSRLKAIKDSSRVIHALSDIGFHYCPACFNEVSHKKTGCCLCGSDLNSESIESDPTFKIRKEIEFQIAESTYLVGKRQTQLSEYDVLISQTNTTLESTLRELAPLERPIYEVDALSRQTLLKVGSLNREIEQINESKLRFAKLHDLYDQRKYLQNELNTVKDEIERKVATIENELKRKKRELSSLTKTILRADSDHEEIFIMGNTVDFDFGEDKVSIDDRVLFSASSMVYLKNAFRLAMLEASCIDKSYLYPRFLLMDNIEDKGMEPQRSHLFQHEIIRVSSKIEIPHQIIFTTSMIDPTLDDSAFCVGIKYDDKNKSLNFSKGQ
jgi:hypothetical protein